MCGTAHGSSSTRHFVIELCPFIHNLQAKHLLNKMLFSHDVLFRFEQEEKRSPSASSGSPSGHPENNSLRRNLMQMLGLTVPRTISTATQTVHRVRRTASTQTDSLGADDVDRDPFSV